MHVHTFQNPYFGSNTFIITLNNNKSVVVDPGNPVIQSITDWVSQNNSKIESVILTHEHFDHCAGVNALFEWSPFELICTEEAAANIALSRQNFSFYVENVNTFEIKLPTKIVRDGDSIQWGAERFDFIQIPGHSPGGLCIKTENAFFTGDTLLYKTKTPLSFPHSNKKDYQRSIEKLKNTLVPGKTIYPGHGESFIYSE